MGFARQVPGLDGKRVPAVDFISTTNSDRTAKGNNWCRMLNGGFCPRVTGATDFLCLSGEQVGVGKDLRPTSRGSSILTVGVTRRPSVRRNRPNESN